MQHLECQIRLPGLDNHRKYLFFSHRHAGTAGGQEAHTVQAVRVYLANIGSSTTPVVEAALVGLLLLFLFLHLAPLGLGLLNNLLLQLRGHDIVMVHFHVE